MIEKAAVVRAMCHVAEIGCACAMDGKAHDFAMCKMVDRHADSVIGLLRSQPAGLTSGKRE